MPVKIETVYQELQSELNLKTTILVFVFVLVKSNFSFNPRMGEVFDSMLSVKIS